MGTGTGKRRPSAADRKGVGAKKRKTPMKRAVSQAAKTAGKAAAKVAIGKTARAMSPRAKAARNRRPAGIPELFEPLTEGERAEAQRLLIEDRRLATMAKVGRYRVVAAEPQPVKPPHPLANHR